MMKIAVLVSGGGTGSYYFESNSGVYNELQCGSYAFMDADYGRIKDKDGQRISYTSTQSGNALTVCVGRFTASLRASLATLRQLRAEGIETITFQTILCSTTLSVDELLAMGGEDAEVVLTHHIRSSTLTVGGKAV